ncbi:hypothetical protein [Phytomonospora endophytica]|uniref:Plasmid stability protein n=1 Tax=Phytomonospora endophytica TaxID=714109 RepID=A0A841FTT9_9ACTN|nr:hypothetical protein [Phytomonospora endophytica]MBB6039204.1 plasmid stability protein [Phytomonospora endophytica]GIG67559.1 hypothetical protein Pen01_38540 [Phytomonospora endophytica]
MAQRIEVPELPDDAYDVLLARAQAYGMSVERYVRALLIDQAAQPTAAEVFARTADRPKTGVSVDDIVALQRADRER